MTYRFDQKRIRQVFKAKFRSVNQLARTAHVKYHTTQRAVHGGRISSRADVIKIAEALNICAPEYLVQ